MFINQNEKERYIQEVWDKLQSTYLEIYPFLTGSEFKDLFGEKVVKAMEKLDCPNEACGKCDLEIDCPYYSKMLDRCGIDPFKPVHCRLWYCYDCGPENIVKDIRELTGIFADQLGPETEARRIKYALEQQYISKEEAEVRFWQLIAKYRKERK